MTVGNARRRVFVLFSRKTCAPISTTPINSKSFYIYYAWQRYGLLVELTYAIGNKMVAPHKPTCFGSLHIRETYAGGDVYVLHTWNRLVQFSKMVAVLDGQGRWGV